MKVAVIDDGIQVDSAVYIKRLLFDLACSEGIVRKRVEEVPEGSHGTIVAEIIQSFDDNIEIGSLKIISSKERGGSVQELAAAIRWCLQNEIDLIHMSVGTTDWNDFEVLTHAIREAAGKIQMLAAAHNAERLSLPAALPEVWSVSWRDGTGCTVKQKTDRTWNICSDLLLPEILQERYGWYLGFSNSFQAAAVSGCLIKEHILDGRGIQINSECLKAVLEEYSRETEDAKKMKGLNKSPAIINGEKLLQDIPVIWIRTKRESGDTVGENDTECARELIRLFYAEGYHAAGVTDIKYYDPKDDILLDYVDNITKETLLFSLGKFRPDILLAFSEGKPLEEVDYCVDLDSVETCFKAVLKKFE